MVKRLCGFRRRTRQKLSKPVRNKGKISIRNFVQTFKIGDKVVLYAEPAYQKGMYLPRFHGRTVDVIGKRGRCYQVSFVDQNKAKSIIVHPVHLRRWQK